MPCCLLFFDDSPVDGDERNRHGRQWQTGMKDAACADPACCFAGFVFPCGATMYLRKQALGRTLDDYSCCQGYFDCCCIQAGSLGESDCPCLCLCIESFLCTHFAVQATRFCETSAPVSALAAMRKADAHPTTLPPPPLHAHPQT